MPITLAALTANRKALAIQFPDGDTLHIEYYPMRLTTRMLLQFAQADALGDLPADQALGFVASAGEMLLQLLASWDLVESVAEDGTPGPALPVTEETIGALGLPLQWAMVAAIMQDTGDAGKAQAPKGKKRSA